LQTPREVRWLLTAQIKTRVCPECNDFYRVVVL
jgi:hypothetical protein